MQEYCLCKLYYRIYGKTDIYRSPVSLQHQGPAVYCRLESRHGHHRGCIITEIKRSGYRNVQIVTQREPSAQTVIILQIEPRQKSALKRPGY